MVVGAMVVVGVTVVAVVVGAAPVAAGDTVVVADVPVAGAVEVDDVAGAVVSGVVAAGASVVAPDGPVAEVAASSVDDGEHAAARTNTAHVTPVDRRAPTLVNPTRWPRSRPTRPAADPGRTHRAPDRPDPRTA